MSTFYEPEIFTPPFKSSLKRLFSIWWAPCYQFLSTLDCVIRWAWLAPEVKKKLCRLSTLLFYFSWKLGKATTEKTIHLPLDKKRGLEIEKEREREKTKRFPNIIGIKVCGVAHKRYIAFAARTRPFSFRFLPLLSYSLSNWKEAQKKEVFEGGRWWLFLSFAFNCFRKKSPRAWCVLCVGPTWIFMAAVDEFDRYVSTVRDPEKKKQISRPIFSRRLVVLYFSFAIWITKYVRVKSWFSAHIECAHINWPYFFIFMRSQQ